MSGGASQTSTALGDLAFRRQFVLGPEVPEILDGWRRHRVTGELVLSVHPDLDCAQVDRDGRSLILLGYVLDPKHPQRDDASILTDLLSTTTTFGDVLRAFDSLSGRWAAIYLAEGRVRLFHDPAALRQVHHARDNQGAVWCGSRPELLARVTGLPADAEAQDHLRSYGVSGSGSPTHFWPGSGTGFVGISRLLPNHFLDATTGEVRRYWPTAAIAPVDPDTAIETCATILTGVIGAAATRYPLALSVTAGYDSRVLLAASRPHMDALAFYTLSRPTFNRLSPDVVVPQQILRDQGRDRTLIPVPSMSRSPVATTIRETFSPYHDRTADEAAALAAAPPRPDGQWVTVNGNVSEIARFAYPRVETTPESFASFCHMAGSSYATTQFEDWYRRALPVIEVSGIDTLAFFYWEQRLSSWLGTVRTEFDVVEEGVTPYNCRALLECILGVDEPLRDKPAYPFYRRLAAHMWPRMLDYPINPPDRINRLRRGSRAAAKSALTRLGLRRG